MATYHYRAIARDGTTAAGSIEAADVDAARSLLAERGLQSIDLSPEPAAQFTPPPLPRTAGDAQEIAEQLAAAARAGLPLAPALRAAAAELPNRRAASSLAWLAAQLEAGRPLEDVLESHPDLLPAHLRYLVRTSLRSGNFSDMLVRLVEIHRASDDLWRNIRLALSYPIVLIVALIVVATLVWGYVIPGIETGYRSLLSNLHWTTDFVVWLSSETAILIAAVLITTLSMVAIIFRSSLSAPARRRFLYGIPLFGPVLYWRGASTWSQLLALLVRQKVPLPDALRLAAEGVNDANFRTEGFRLARAVSQGQILSDAIGTTLHAPASLQPLIRWGEQNDMLATAFETAGELFNSRARMRAAMLQIALPPIIFALAAFGSLGIACSILTPTLSFINRLSFFSWSWSSRQQPIDWSLPLAAAGAILLSLYLAGRLMVRIAQSSGKIKIPSSRFGFLLSALKAMNWSVFFICLLVLLIGLGSIGRLETFQDLGKNWGTLLWLTLVIICIANVIQINSADRRALLWTLGVTVERGIPLHTAAVCFANERTDGLGRKSRRLAALLEGGMPLDAALCKSRIRIPTDVLVSARMQSTTGSSGDSLHRTMRIENNLAQLMHDVVGRALYLTIFLLALTIVLIYMLGDVVPSYEQILNDFKVNPPYLTQMIIDTSQFFAENWWVIPVFAAFLIASAAVSLLRYTGVIRWDPPLLWRIWRQLDQSVIARSLAQAVEGRRAVSTTLEALAVCYPKHPIRLALKQASLQVGQGGNWCDALQANGLLAPHDAGVLQAAERVGNLGWALRDTADRLVRRFVARCAGFLAISFPIALLAVAALVAIFVVGMFVPLVELIERASLTQ